MYIFCHVPGTCSPVSRSAFVPKLYFMENNFVSPCSARSLIRRPPVPSSPAWSRSQASPAPAFPASRTRARVVYTAYPRPGAATRVPGNRATSQPLLAQRDCFTGPPRQTRLPFSLTNRLCVLRPCERPSPKTRQSRSGVRRAHTLEWERWKVGARFSSPEPDAAIYIWYLS